ncbi:MAG TPA: corrinoid protein [Bacteroidales bacterium]|nr:corrinoid protein [Bacteroidales bacterium]
MNNELLVSLAECVEFGKVNKSSPYPPNMKDKDGADEITLRALEEGISAQDILSKGLMPGMERVGVKFRDNKIFVPQVLMAAKSMDVAMKQLKPYFDSGAAVQKGTFIIGTVLGDLHDIGKNLVAMMVEGNGYKVIDLGTDVGSDKFIQATNEHPDAVVGLSALLTTTMASMETITNDIKKAKKDTLVVVGGAPVTEDFKEKIGADNYSSDPLALVEFLNTVIC